MDALEVIEHPSANGHASLDAFAPNYSIPLDPTERGGDRAGYVPRDASETPLEETEGHGAHLKPLEKPYTPPALKVAIVGSWPNTLREVPCGDPSWEVWSCSGSPAALARVTRHFELHDFASHAAKWKQDGTWNVLAAVPKLILAEAHPDFPDADLYPLDVMLARYGRYFTSSIAYMLALAIESGATEIGLYGVNMETDDASGNSEYGHQRACVEFLLGVAMGRGIRCVIPDACDLTKATRLYAYESNRGQGFERLESRTKELKAKLAAAEKKLKDAEQEVCVLRGAIAEHQFFRRYV